MTATQFKEWLAEMQSAGLAESDAECARLLGVHVQTVKKRKNEGADRETELACLALLRGIDAPTTG